MPESHFLRRYGFDSVPERITYFRKTDSIDTPENRFIKHALETFLKFCSDINAVAVAGSKLDNESFAMIRKLESQLYHSFFNEISKPTTLKLNSSVLQRKEGYREILRAWLMFDLAAKLIWTGGNDVYDAGKKDIATLYEYWLFFKLLELFQSLFDINPRDIEELIKTTPDGLNLQLKQGIFTALSGTYDSGTRKLNMRFNYNRTFSGKKRYPSSGSWTTTLRPDYTLSIWPNGITENDAEIQELIVHIHFDAKYKVANLQKLFEAEGDLNTQKNENRQGIYKNADLLKMHAYKDAIRRTGGSYVLYPGNHSKNQRGFHEIIPGLGAYAVSPSKVDDGINDLRAFVVEVVEHLCNRASQRERLAYRTYDIFNTVPKPSENLQALLPEPYNNNRSILPDETFVLIASVDSEERHTWIKKQCLYPISIETGSVVFNVEVVTSKFLLLYSKNELCSGKLWRIPNNGFRSFSKEKLADMGYPFPTGESYLVVDIEVTEKEFDNVRWDIEILASQKGQVELFTTTLSQLMRNVLE